LKYDSISVALEVYRKQIKLYKDALSLCPKVMEVVRKFDGKIANRRLETALQEVDKGLGCFKDKWNNQWIIKFYTYDRSVDVQITSWDGKDKYCRAFYIKESETVLAQDIFKNSYGDFTNEDGRWIAENICKQIEATMKRLEEDIERYEEELKHADELLEEKRKLVEMIEAHNKKVSWMGDEYFEMRVNKRY